MLLDKIVKYIENKIPEENKETGLTGVLSGVLFSVLFGVLSGVLFGVLSGVLFGVLSGVLFGGLTGVLFGVLSGVLFGGLTGGLTGGLFDFIQSSPSLYLIAIILAIILVITEIFFLYDKKKPNGQNVFKFTIKRKIIAFVEATIIVLSLVGLRQSTIKIYPELNNFLKLNGTSLIDTFGYIIGIIIILYIYIKLNSLKYKK